MPLQTGSDGLMLKFFQACRVCLAVLVFACMAASAQGAELQQLQQLLLDARVAKGSDCTLEADALSRVLCSGQLRVGVRTNYPPYAWRQDGSPQGFELDLARQLARLLGLEAQFTVVTPANRIALLGEGRIDVTIATMGHTTQRDREVLFVRPHYYQSQTVVLGRRELVLPALGSLRGNTVCVTVGNNTNADLSASGARLMLFDNAVRLVDELRLGGCSFGGAGRQLFCVLPAAAGICQSLRRQVWFCAAALGCRRGA
jgi:ABC-type amino acid transport substrate-binding protein